MPGVRSLGPLLYDRRRRLHRMDRLRIHLLQDVSFSKPEFIHFNEYFLTPKQQNVLLNDFLEK